jgi:hypothetical protein
MWIFIKGIPATTTPKALGQFLNKRLNRNWMAQAFFEPEIRQCAILRITDRDTNSVEYHGLAEIESPKPDNSTIEQLSGQTLLGKKISIRKYYHRTTCDNPWHQGTIDVVREIKRGDRRRPNLKIEFTPAGMQRPSYATSL